MTLGRLCVATALAVAAIAPSTTLDLAAQPRQAPVPAPRAEALRVIPIKGNIFMVAGDGGNVTLSIGKDGVMVVDTGTDAGVPQLLETIRTIDRQVTSAMLPQRACVGVVQGCTWWNSSNLLPSTVAPPPPRPLAGIINTSADRDHIGGNAQLARAGRTFGVRNLSGGAALGAWIVAHENVSLRLSPGGEPVVPAGALPNEVYFGDEKKLNFFNGEGVVIMHVDNAHSDGDSMVYFRGSDVIAAGDVFNMASYPTFDPKNGGSIDGLVRAANKLLDVIVWEHMMEGGTMVVPGHGRLADVADVAYYRDMLTILRDRVQAMREKGMTLAQVKAAKPTKDYDPRWGRDPQWTPDQFVDAIFASLAGAAQ